MEKGKEKILVDPSDVAGPSAIVVKDEKEEYEHNFESDVKSEMGLSGKIGEDPIMKTNENSSGILRVKWSDLVEEEEEDPSDEEEKDDDDGSQNDKSEDGSENSSEKEVGGKDCDELEYIVDPETKGVSFEDTESCLCYTSNDSHSLLSLLQTQMEVFKTNTELFKCCINNVIRCLNHVFGENDEVVSKEKMAATDLFYRFRHEFLFYHLMMSFGIPAEKSDVSFEEYGISSKRTPDCIYVFKNSLLIIEVSVTSSYERSAQLKGIEHEGFESKYKKEIDLLTEKGLNPIYIPVVFEMSNDLNDIHPRNIEYLEGNLIKNRKWYRKMMYCSNQMSIITSYMRSYMNPLSTLLFSSMIEIKPDHANHRFLYESKRSCPDDMPKYKELKISPNVYNKVDNNWQRLDDIISRSGHKSDQKFIYHFDISTNRFKAVVDERGLGYNEIIKIIENNDKISFFNILFLKIGNSIIKSTESDSGISIWDRDSSSSNETDKSKSFSHMEFLTVHEPRIFDKYTVEIQKYAQICKKTNFYEMVSRHRDPSYEDVILSAMEEFDLKTDYTSKESIFNLKLLGEMQPEGNDIDEKLKDVRESYILSNKERDEIPVKKLRMKQPFIYPLSTIQKGDYCDLSYKNHGLMMELYNVIGINNSYTRRVISEVMREGFMLYTVPKVASTNLNNLLNKRRELSNNINLLQKKMYKIPPKDGILKISKTSDQTYKDSFDLLKKDISNLNKVIKTVQNEEGIKNQSTMVRLPTKSKKGLLRSEYETEMLHFKDKKVQSTVEGVGIRDNLESDFKSDQRVFQSICRSLVQFSGENPDPLIHDYVSDDAKLLSDLKKLTLDNYRSIINEVKNSRLGHASALISRLCHSLLYYSQLPFSSDYVRVDNLGYKNCLLFVKGGKKIFKSKSTKMFRILYPIMDETIPWFTEGHNEKSSTLIFEFNGRNYAFTPWQMFNESIVCEGISFYPRITSFVVLNSNEKQNFQPQFGRLSLNILLSFHNRRQTEVMLANLRYILLSTLGDFTGVLEIIKEFFGFNYDCFQSYVRGCILFNYPSYFRSLYDLKNNKVRSGKDISISDFKNLHLKNLFSGEIISETEDLALMIYSTFLMTKAPYQRSVERANNIKGILEIHELYDKTISNEATPEEQLSRISVECKGDYEIYVKELFSNDFNIDPKYCSLVGNFLDCQFEQQGMKSELSNSWFKIINKTWDELSTSTGLRGDYNKIEDFWGKKGYFVVYKEMLNNIEFREGMEKILWSDMYDDTKRKLLKSLNVTFLGKIEQDRDFLIFHAVDKVQWRGGREIYVMDLVTKTLQQPIEQYMAEICKKMDNELISVPSDRRSQVIHHSIFEKDIPKRDVLTWYLTLDCTKWAPKSVFVKFAICILNMKCLPSSFKVHFLNYIEKLYKKRIYFNSQEVKVLEENPMYNQSVKKYLVKDENLNGYYLEMNYSWVMGIFNYTSSFFHAANQRYFSYLIMKSSLRTYKEETNITMFAHSDDSGGRLTVENKEMAKRALIHYEINLKCCNHLISKKKSVVSRIYFEILSIIYIFKKLFALLPKFLGGLRFLPTDKGPAQDMLQSYSKCIELLTSGASFAISYIAMKFYSMLVWRFYHNREVMPSDYKRPVQYLGMPDSHPMMALLCGSDCDLLRIIGSGVDLKPITSFVQNFIQTSDEAGPIKPLLFEIKVRGLSKDFDPFIERFKEFLEVWSVRNVNYHNSVFNCLSFLSKLKNPGFVGTLVNENTSRRISRCFFIRSGDSCVTNFGNMKLQPIVDSLRIFQAFSDKGKSINMLLSDIHSPEKIIEINNDIEERASKLNPQFEILNKTLNSALNLYKYLNLLSMEKRRILESYRTLKPTVIQLVKTARVFSSTFDPSSLVSYIKDPGFNWAINDVRGLITSKIEVESFLNEIGIDIKEISHDNLLRICRTYGKENTKTLYIYSRVPSELRQVKSLSSFLTFLAVNSFDNMEIEGLNVKLTSGESVTEYIETNVDSEIYEINNILSSINVFYRKLDIDFFLSLKIKSVDFLRWEGGEIRDFISHIKTYMDENIYKSVLEIQINHFMNMISGRERSAINIKRSAFYMFTKSQKIRKGWYGKGEVYINIENSFYIFSLMNSEIIGVRSNVKGKIPAHHQKFLKDVFSHTNIKSTSFRTRTQSLTTPNKLYFGNDFSGSFSIGTQREIREGVECLNTEQKGKIMDDLGFYKITGMQKDYIFIESSINPEERKKKIYFLPIKKTEIAPIIRKMYYEEQFREKLSREGLNDFEEFILTEIMTDYGFNTYVGLKEFFDGYNGSKLFQIFKTCTKENISKLPTTFRRSNLPAQEGSLTRILIDYSIAKNENILKPPKYLDSEIMKIRSEYPEQMSVILSENLVKSHRNIYNDVERAEIKECYYKFYEGQSLEESRISLIKLMTFWGYGSLVNSIQEFNLIKSQKNYVYFNVNMKSPDKINHFYNLYPYIMERVIKTMVHFFESGGTYNIEHKYIINKLQDVSEVCKEYLFEVCYSIPTYQILNIFLSISNLKFNSYLHSFLDQIEFCSTLQKELEQNYILSCLIIDAENKNNFLVLLNNLRDCWTKYKNEIYIKNGTKTSLDFTKKLQRIEGFNPYNEISDFGLSVNPSTLYYHNFIDDRLKRNLNRLEEIKCSDGTIYRIESKTTNFSTDEVFTHEYLKFKRPLRKSVLESEEFEELSGEFEFGDIDEETIDEIWSSIKNPYVEKKTKRYKYNDGKIIRCQISWIINPYCGSSKGNIKNIRQTAENVVYLANFYDNRIEERLYNSGARHVNYNKKGMIAHYTFQDELNNEEFIKRYIGGEQVLLNKETVSDLVTTKLRECDTNVKETMDIGLSNLPDDFFKNKVPKTVDNITYMADQNDGSDKEEHDASVLEDEKEREKEEYFSFKKKLDEIMDDMESKGLSKKSLKIIRSKYLNKIYPKKVPLELIFKSVVKESELNIFNEMLVEDKLKLDGSEQTKSFLSPDYFLLGHNLSHNPNDSSIKDGKVRAEVGAVSKEIIHGIGSSSIPMSDKMERIIKTNVKLWKNTIKVTRFQKQNKMFLFTEMLSIFNSTKNDEKNAFDEKWQEIINNVSELLTTDPDDDENDDFLKMLMEITESTRLKYKPEGS